MSFNLKTYQDKLLFIPLGGTNEIGINVNLYHYQGKWIMIDCGSGFADDYLPGVDMVVADLSFIEAHKENLLGIILTHSHEDHLGAIQYLWSNLAEGCKKIGLGFLAKKCKEMYIKKLLVDNKVANLDKHVSKTKFSSMRSSKKKDASKGQIL